MIHTTKLHKDEVYQDSNCAMTFHRLIVETFSLTLRQIDSPVIYTTVPGEENLVANRTTTLIIVQAWSLF